jgi:zinc protease
LDYAGDVPVDQDAVYGNLSNGLRYCIIPRKEPPNRVSVRLYVAAGSLMESESQRGIAHFLEHIAFCGSENFTQGDLIESLQHMGMQFGHHSNAYTSFEETVYKLELPRNDRRTLKEGFLVFRDYLGGLDIAEGEVNRERGVILAEMRHRDTPQYRDMVDYYQFMFPNCPIGKRMPIGLTSVVQATEAADMRKFYETFYRTDNAIVAVIGDVDVDMACKCMEHVMGDLPTPVDPIPQLDLGTFKTSGIRVYIHRDPELSKSTVSICTTRPLINFRDTQAVRSEELIVQVANHIIARRLERLSKVPGAIFFDGSCGSHCEVLNGARVAWLCLTCADGREADAVRVGEQELRRALDFGFNDAEIERAVAEILKELANAKDRAHSRRSDLVAEDWVAAAGSCRTFSSAEWDYEFAKAVFGRLTKREVWAQLQNAWSPKNRQVYVSGNLPMNVTENSIRSAFSRSKYTVLSNPNENAAAAFSYSDFGRPGTVKSQSYDPELALHCYTFENGVRLNVKVTHFDAKQVFLRMRVGQGLLSEPSDQAGLSKFAQWSFLNGGLGRHSFEDVRDLFSGKNWSLQFSVTPEAFLFAGHSTQDCLRDELNLLCAYVCDAAFSPTGEQEGKKAMAQVYSNLKHSIRGVLSNGVDKFLHCEDQRFGYPSKNIMSQYSSIQLREWMEPVLRDGYLEITIVGDVDVDQVVSAVAHTLGALDSRSGSPAPFNNRVTLPDRQMANFTYDSTIAKGYVQCIWPTGDMWDVGRKRRLDLLADILSDRVRVRISKELAEAYSPGAGNFASMIFKDYGYLYAHALVDIEKINEIAAAIDEIAQELRIDGIDDDEFLRAKEPMRTEVRELLRKNSYWISALDGIQANPQKLEMVRTFPTFYENVQKNDLKEVLKFLDEGRRIAITIRPQ